MNTAHAQQPDCILIVGSGAREHAIAAALARSTPAPQLLCFGSTRNPGITSLTTAYTTGSLTDPTAITAFARTHNATLAIIGPEAPLAAAVADALLGAGIPTVGPTQSLARIESSKGFTRDLLTRHAIAGNPRFRRFTSLEGVEEFLNTLASKHVIKDDGLAGGKGVKVFGDHLHSHADSLAFCRELAALHHPFVIEEKLEGEEFSLISFCDGHTLRHTPLVQDHKRAFAGDTGPNTGGMGTYTSADHSLPFLTPADLAAASAINERVIAALQQDCGAPYRGFLYGGFMATRDGVRLIEYNARLGDPECLNLLTLLETDFAAVCHAIAHGSLASLDIIFAAQASVCKYLVPAGYPDAPRIGDAVTLPAALPPNTHLFLGAVDQRDESLIATGSRTLAIVATAPTLTEAEALCEQTIATIPGPFLHREDIGTAALLQKRIDHMHALRPTPTNTAPLRVAVLGSTRGTALQGILDAIANHTLAAEVTLVISNKPDAPILTRAAAHHVPHRFIDPTNLTREAFDAEVTAAIEAAHADLVLMIGYMRIVSSAFVQHWRGRLLNVHPSLLPAFAGLMNNAVHAAVLDAHVAETGCTIHQVTEDVDAGEIVLQKRCAVLPTDTVETLKARVQSLEQQAFIEVLQTWPHIHDQT